MNSMVSEIGRRLHAWLSWSSILVGALACQIIAIGLYFNYLPEPNKTVVMIEIVVSLFFTVVLWCTGLNKLFKEVQKVPATIAATTLTIAIIVLPIWWFFL